MAKVFLVNARGVPTPPTDHLEIYLTAAAPPGHAALLTLKKQLAAKWPVDDLKLRRVPLRLRNPVEPHTIGLFLGTLGHEIHVHFWEAVRDGKDLLSLTVAVKSWWGKNANLQMH
jgi:hypothetical protein